MNISFFIPAYNCAKTVTESVESVFQGNFTEGDELILVNDCSTDDTGTILADLKIRFPQIEVITHARNKGGAAARNTAVENAKNHLLFCLDSDNVLEKDSIPALKDYLIQMQADVASFQFQHFFLGDKHKPEYIWSLPEGEISLDAHLKGDNVPGQHGNYLFTKKSWKNALGYAEGTGALDTSTFGLRQAITGAKFVSLKDTYYFHRLDYDNSYWMRDAEANMWTVSIKAMYAFIPFLHLLDESFVEYMMGKGKYTWFYNLKKRPIVLADKTVKEAFYKELHVKVRNFVYPPASLTERAVNKIKRTLKK